MKKLVCKTKIFTRHAIQKMFQRKISKSEIDIVISTGKIIKEYPNDLPQPSLLILGFNKNRPLHIVIGFNKLKNICIIVTVYEPDPEIWKNDFTRRIEK